MQTKRGTLRWYQLLAVVGPVALVLLLCTQLGQPVPASLAESPPGTGSLDPAVEPGIQATRPISFT